MQTLLCPYCNGPVEAAPSLAGQNVSCPHCAQVFPMAFVPAVAPYKPSPRRQKPDAAQQWFPIVAMLLGGCLLCGVLLVGWVAMNEYRQQRAIENTKKELEKLNTELEGSRDAAIRAMREAEKLMRESER